MEIIDIRQSDLWSAYLALYGWKSFKLSNDLILRIHKNFFFRKASLQMPKSLSSEDLGLVEHLCEENKISRLILSPNLDQDLTILKSRGYHQTNNFEIAPNTMVLDLSQELSFLWQHFSRNCRYSINKSDREHCYSVMIEGPIESKIDEHYKVVAARSKRKNYAIDNLEVMKHKIEIFGNEAYICNVHNSKGDILGSKLFLGYGGTIWGINSGTTKIGQKSTAGYKLLLDCIKYFKEKGYKRMDLGGVDDKRLKETQEWKHFSDYKREFSGETVYFELPFIKHFK